MSNYLTVRDDGLVTNVIVWDGVTPYQPDGTLLPTDDNPGVWVGWRFVDGEWVAPPEPDDLTD
jgi:hypothetical protein